MSTINENTRKDLLKGKKRGIRDIPRTIRSGMRMTKQQLQACLAAAVILVAALFLVMTVAGNRAEGTVTVNEEARLLRDAAVAERILSVDGKKVAFQEGYARSGEGMRTILNERITTSKEYWVTLGTESEIAAYEEVLGEGRFLPLETLEGRNIWIMMGTADEVQKVQDADGKAQIVPLNNIPGPEWLRKGTDAENKAAEAAFGNIRFIQFEKLGNTHIRLRRGLESEITRITDQKVNYRKWRMAALLLLVAAAGLMAYGLKSAKMNARSESFRKGFRAAVLLAALVLLGSVMFLTVRMDQTQDQLIRAQAMIMPVEGEGAEEEEGLPETTDSGEKFTFIAKDNTEKTVSIPEEMPGEGVHRTIQYAALALLGLAVFGLLYLFRYERDLGFPLFNTIFLIILMMVTVYPVLNTLAISFNDGTDAVRGGIGVLPRKFSMKSYDNILSKQEIFDAAWVSASKTVIITVLNLFWTGMLAYALSRKEYVLRKFITTVMVLTMYVNAGLIPTYLLISQTLNLAHTYWVYIIPTMMSCFNMIVIRTYIAGLPDALVESARIDGAGDFRIYWRIIFPLCTPVLATVALFVAVGSWNSWFDTRLYNAGQRDPKTLQYLLQMKILTAGQNANAANTSTDALKVANKVEPITIRSAITVVSTVPILVVYPFLQKYFVTGMALGSVKG